jgi:hypothetical protein
LVEKTLSYLKNPARYKKAAVSIPVQQFGLERFKQDLESLV